MNVGKSPTVLRDQPQADRATSPQFLQVYVSGRVNRPVLSPLCRACKPLIWPRQCPNGKVEFLRHPRCTIDRRVQAQSDAPLEDYRNPVLMAGDLIRVLNSPLNKSLSIFNELTQPAIGLYSPYSLFHNFSN